jgi:hypothetical protein
MYNIFKVLYNIGHIIYYRLHMAWLHLIDVEIPITNPFSSIGIMKPNPIDIPNPISIKQEIRGDIIEGIREDIRDGVRGDIRGDDVAKALGHMDEDGSYIKKIKYKPYDGPVCETP